ncbi:MAG TPA: peptidoglycan endopeptidase [Campylobacterales bacterium]|nr:peptidoglycan endopeptidase [Campylobacterales bacterium]
MKKRIMKKIILLSSVAFFVACSNTTPEPKNQPTKNSLSVYNIMGIEKSEKKASPLFVLKEQSDQNYYNFTTEGSSDYQDSNDIEIISYGSNPSNQINSYVSNDVEIISYGSYQPMIQNLRNSNSKKLKNDIEWNAKSFLGTRYVWGATGPRTFDCSGFTQWVYRDAGITIPRVSRDQARVGAYVRYENLTRGDMVFFDTKKRRTGKVCHVGIYLGSGNFIHASSSAKKVVIYNFNKKSFYKERFLWGRRVIPQNRQFTSI